MKKKLILVTGGCGYIGSHTVIQLIKQGFDVVSIDNFSRASSIAIEKIEQITGYKIKNYNIDLVDSVNVENVFAQIENIFGVIHFAAFKSVPESTKLPELYYKNNIFSLINILENCIRYGVKQFVYSSSCSVYGDIDKLPVDENTIISDTKSPYASSKLMGERITKDICMSHHIKAMSLRYFNPVGAHPSGNIGEMSLLSPDNLVPVIMETAIGKRKSMMIFGGNLNTRDGSCVRDFVHIMDVADAHVLALEHLSKVESEFEIINLGTGTGVSVFEAVAAFEKVSGIKLNFIIESPRNGDVIEIFSDVTKAKNILGWVPKYNIEDMMSTAWAWQMSRFSK